MTGDTAVLPPAPSPGNEARIDAAVTLILAAALCAVTAFADGGMRLGATTGTEIGMLLVSAAVVAAALVAAPPRDRLHGALPVLGMLVLTAFAAWSIAWPSTRRTPGSTPTATSPTSRRSPPRSRSPTWQGGAGRGCWARSR